MTSRIMFARWRSDAPSGGNRYDDELTAHLTARGIDVREHAVTGSWPLPHPHDRTTFHELLTQDQVNDGAHWLVDNIVASAAPETVASATQSGARVSMLMHYFAADERGVSTDVQQQLAIAEAVAVAAATSVIATSRWTAKEVARRYDRADVVVAVPGVAPAPLAARSTHNGSPPHLLWLARLTSTKDPSTFISALAGIRDLNWHARLVGPDTIDPELRERVRQQIVDAGLAGRIDLTGAQGGESLEATWSETNLLVHTSRAEAYGMVVTEALSRGIPSIVSSGTGAVEAQHGVGATFTPGDARDLAAKLREWITDADVRTQWRGAALKQRSALPAWEETARTIADALLR